MVDVANFIHIDLVQRLHIRKLIIGIFTTVTESETAHAYVGKESTEHWVQRWTCPDPSHLIVGIGENERPRTI